MNENEKETNQFFSKLSTYVTDMTNSKGITSKEALKFAINLLVIYGLDAHLTKAQFEKLALDELRKTYSETFDRVENINRMRSSPEHMMSAMGLGDWEFFENGKFVTADDKIKGG